MCLSMLLLPCAHLYLSSQADDDMPTIFDKIVAKQVGIHSEHAACMSAAANVNMIARAVRLLP